MLLNAQSTAKVISGRHRQINTETGRDRQRKRHRQRQTDRQTDRQAGKQAGRDRDTKTITMQNGIVYWTMVGALVNPHKTSSHQANDETAPYA